MLYDVHSVSRFQSLFYVNIVPSCISSYGSIQCLLFFLSLSSHPPSQAQVKIDVLAHEWTVRCQEFIASLGVDQLPAFENKPGGLRDTLVTRVRAPSKKVRKE